MTPILPLPTLAPLQVETYTMVTCRNINKVSPLGSFCPLPAQPGSPLGEQLPHRLCAVLVSLQETVRM